MDATPSHSYLRYLYKYPQAEYPYTRLVEENRRRNRIDAPFNLLDSGVFDESRYWDFEVRYAKVSPQEIHVRVTVANRGPEIATLHVLPTLWFRNTWAWGRNVDEWGSPKDESHPLLAAAESPKGAQWAVRAQHETLSEYFLYGRDEAEPLFTNNETNAQRLWGVPGATPYVKDAFHRYVVNGEKDAVNPNLAGTKFAACHVLKVEPGQSASISMVLSSHALAQPFGRQDAVFARRETER